MFFGLTANAQEFAVVNGEALGLNPDAVTDVAAGTVLASTENVTMSTAFDDAMKIVSINGPKMNDNSLKIFNVNGAAINETDQGVQGNNNPKDADGTGVAVSLATPTQGSVLQFDVKADGYIYVFFKGSSNKSYAAYESGQAMAYSLAQAYGDGEGKVMGYTLTGDDEFGYLYLKNHEGGLAWVEQLSGVTDADNPIKLNGCAVAKFPVYADAAQYYFSASGSKISVLGYYFDTTGDATVTVTDADGNNAVTLMQAGAVVTGINTVAKAEAAANAPLYNLAGQQVSSSYKGIVLQNGKKFINK